jgi:ribosome-binding protein aMBF1 (putative translation factor)
LREKILVSNERRSFFNLQKILLGLELVSKRGGDMEVVRRSNAEIEKELGTVAYFIRRKRKERGVTQEILAKESGVGLAFLKRLEGGDENLHMAKVLQVLRHLNADLFPKEYQ